MIDTDILIDAFRGRAEAAVFLNHHLAEGTASISIVSAMELVTGARDTVELRALRQFIGQFEVVDIGPRVSRDAYHLMVSFALSHGMRMPDALIAVSAMHIGKPLYTKNTKHFRMIPGLLLERPYA